MALHSGRIVKTIKGKVGIVYNNEMYKGLPKNKVCVHVIANSIEEYTSKDLPEIVKLLCHIDSLTFVGFID